MGHLPEVFTVNPVSLQRLWLWSSNVKKFFEGISISQIIAGSLAAITSFFLAGKIGIAGSTIGAAASYIISTVAGKVYQNVLKASGEKLQAASPLDDSPGKPEDAAPDKAGQTEETEQAEQPEPTDDTRVLSDTQTSTDTGSQDAASSQGAADVEDTADMASADQPRTIASSGTLPSDKEGKVQTFAQVRHHNVKHMAIIVSLISGLVGVAITAGVVMLFTQGKGTDTVVRDMTGKSSVVETPDDGTDQNRQDAGTQDPGNYGTDNRKSHGDDTDSQYDSEDSTEQNSTGTDSGAGSDSGTSSNSGSTGSSTSGNSSSSGSSTGQNGGSGSTGSSGSSTSGNSSSPNGSGSSGSSTNSGSTGTGGGTGSSTSGTDSGTSGSTGTSDSSGSAGSN